MFRIYFTNFGYYSANESVDQAGAEKIARQAGFQSQIQAPDGTVRATYCPAVGIRKLA